MKRKRSAATAVLIVLGILFALPFLANPGCGTEGPGESSIDEPLEACDGAGKWSDLLVFDGTAWVATTCPTCASRASIEGSEGK